MLEYRNAGMPGMPECQGMPEWAILPAKACCVACCGL